MLRQVLKVISFLLVEVQASFCVEPPSEVLFLDDFDMISLVEHLEPLRDLFISTHHLESYSATAFDELGPATLIFAQCCISSFSVLFILKWPQNQRDAITVTILCICEIKLMFCL